MNERIPSGPVRTPQDEAMSMLLYERAMRPASAGSLEPTQAVLGLPGGPAVPEPAGGGR